ncbi:hypothetical protein PG997_006485 [Apiospora hydei]|uniref:C2H2-type domain-containing protein n=1 Tax=Apiospora hydei TaxID=1337664 RepID=A0ABR1WNY6_9PEZI
MPPSWTESQSSMPTLSHKLGDGEKSNIFPHNTCPQSGSTIDANIQQESIDLITQWSCPPGNGYDTEYDAALNLIGMALGEASQETSIIDREGEDFGSLIEAGSSASQSVPNGSRDARRNSGGIGEDEPGIAHRRSGTSSSTRPETTRNNTTKRKRSGVEAREDIDEGGARRAPRRKAKPPDNPRSGLRLACPYQAYNKSQVCFNPSAQNPLGGCAGIGRLRQHLRRRHMPSVRCKRCWRSFDTRQQKADHETTQPLCDARESPPSETMMSGSQESEFERLRMSGPEEISWWKMFQLLIPGLSGRNIASLKLDYWPYYVGSDSFMMPAMTFSNAVLPASQALEVSRPSHPTDDGLFVHQGTGYVATSGAGQKGAPKTCGTFGGMFATSELGSDQSFSTPNLSVDMSSRSGHWTSSPASSVPPMTNPSPSNSPRPADTVLRKNYDRLRNRHAITRKENAELREAAQQARASLSQIDAALEEVLSAEDLPEAVYDRIVEISSMVASMNGKL